MALIVLINLASCEETAKVHCKVSAHVVDDAGVAVEGAKLLARYPIGWQVNPGGGFPTDRYQTSYAMTDGHGNAVLEYDTVSSPDGLVWLKKDGYYENVYKESEWKSAGLKSWSAEVSTVLKPLKHPIPMHAYDNKGDMKKIVNIPEFDKEYGFDLMMAEALPPLGNGKVADFTFTLGGDYPSKGIYDMNLKIRFTEPQDGIVEFLTPQRTGSREPHMPGSVLISGYQAPESGYVREITRTLKRNGEKTQFLSDVDFHRNFYFRTRTQATQDGQIISAYYGKIYGDFLFQAANKDWGYPATLALVTTYFNPTPNDRNVEFDPERNLNPDGKVQQP